MTRYFIYVKKDGKTRYSHTRKAFYDLEEAKTEAKKYNDAYIRGCDEVGRDITDKIYI